MSRIWFWVLVGAIVVFLITVRAVLPLLSVAVLTAYLLYPVVEWLHQYPLRRRARAVAALFAILLLFVLITGAILPLIGNIAEQARNALRTMGPLIEQIYSEPLLIEGMPVTDESGRPIVLADEMVYWLGSQQLENWLDQNVRTLWAIINYVTRSTLGIFTQLLGGLLQTVLGGLLFFFIVFYLLRDGHSIQHNMIALAPDDYQADIARLLNDLGGVWHNFLRGQLILAVIMGVSMWLIATVLGLPHPLFFAFVAGLMEFVPNIGPTVALIPPTVTALLVPSTTLPGLSGVTVAILVIAVWSLMQQL